MNILLLKRLSVRNKHGKLLIRMCSSSESSDSQSRSAALSFTESGTDDSDVRVIKKPVSYKPSHLKEMRYRPKAKPYHSVREMLTFHALPDPPPEWTETPEYPEIVDVTTEGKKKRIRMEWYECIKRLPTVEHKLYEIGKHYSLIHINCGPVFQRYNLLPMQKFITRTHLIKGILPYNYEFNVDEHIYKIKEPILNCIRNHLFESKRRVPKREMRPIQFRYNSPVRIDAALNEDIIYDVANILKKALINECDHLVNSQSDFIPYVSSFWWHKDLPPPFVKSDWFRKPKMDQGFVYKGTHALHIRTDKPLPPIISFDDPLCKSSEIPDFPFNPSQLGLHFKRQGFPVIPGFWPDHSDGFEFPYMIFLSRHEMKDRELINRKSFSDNDEVLNGMAIMSSFAWLNAIAANHGFTVYDELTYPFVTHVVITDGQFWSFYVYQFNTHSFHSDVDTDSRRNICWSIGDLKLFDSFENGEFKGVNDDVLKYITRFYLKKTEDVNYDLYPYLDRTKDDRTEEEMAEHNYHLKYRFLNRFSNYKAARQKVHLWEKIYKRHHLAIQTPHLRVRPKIISKFPPFFK